MVWKAQNTMWPQQGVSSLRKQSCLQSKTLLMTQVSNDSSYKGFWYWSCIVWVEQISVVISLWWEVVLGTCCYSFSHSLTCTWHRVYKKLVIVIWKLTRVVKRQWRRQSTKVKILKMVSRIALDICWPIGGVPGAPFVRCQDKQNNRFMTSPSSHRKAFPADW